MKTRQAHFGPAPPPPSQLRNYQDQEMAMMSSGAMADYFIGQDYDGRAAGAEEDPMSGSAYDPHLQQRWQNELMARRYSSPQMGYYDLITGEYRYRSNSDNQNQMSSLSNYAGETEPPMCENTCQWCQIRLPFNCLTISLITCLMLLIMFSLFQAILATNTKNPVNTSLFNDMIFLMSLLTVVFFVLTIVRYICIEKFNLCNYGLCKKCKLFTTIITDAFSTDSSKHISYAEEHHPNADEQFV